MPGNTEAQPIAPILAAAVPPRAKATLYPSPFGERMAGREKRTLGDRFGLKNFGVNLTSLAPGAQSSIKHQHSVQDEFIYVVQGSLTLLLDDREYTLEAGMCFGFAAGRGSHALINRSDAPVFFLEIGDRAPSDEVSYPDDDLQVGPGPDGRRRYEHKDGTPY
jgi:uncharacterized cupin superfamily protein